MLIHFVNWATPADWDCYLDDHGNCETIEHLANPVGLPYIKIEDAMADAMAEHESSLHDGSEGTLELARMHTILSWKQSDVDPNTMYGLNAAGDTELVLVVRSYTLTAGAVEIVAV